MGANPNGIDFDVLMGWNTGSNFAGEVVEWCCRDWEADWRIGVANNEDRAMAIVRTMYDVSSEDWDPEQRDLRFHSNHIVSSLLDNGVDVITFFA